MKSKATNPIYGKHEVNQLKLYSRSQYVHLISLIVRGLSIVNEADQVEGVATNNRIKSSSMGFKTIKFLLLCAWLALPTSLISF